MRSISKLVVLGLTVVIAVALVVLLFRLVLEYRWCDLLAPSERLTAEMPAATDRDSCCRVIMIGDSWAGLHDTIGSDSLMEQLLADAMRCRVSFVSKGRGGAKSSEVYRLMFEKHCLEDELQNDYGTQNLIEELPDYCIVMAGINDAAANMGVDYYQTNYRLIIDWLLENGIKPVVVEMPYVNIKHLHRDKPIYDKIVDHVRAWLTHCKSYSNPEYSEALKEMLETDSLMENVVFVGKENWNADGCKDSRGLYLDDQIHLNAKGYYLLDSCIAVTLGRHRRDDMLHSPVKQNSSYRAPCDKQ